MAGIDITHSHSHSHTNGQGQVHAHGHDNSHHTTRHDHVHDHVHEHVEHARAATQDKYLAYRLALATPTSHAHLSHHLAKIDTHVLVIPPLHQPERRAESDAHKISGSLSIQQLLKAHVFEDTHIAHHKQIHTDDPGAIRSKPVKAIRVVYESDSKKDGHTATSTFHINKRGKIEVFSNPDKHNDQTLVVTVERAAGHLGPPNHAEQKSLNALVGYLSDRYQCPDASPAKPAHRPMVEDQMDVVGVGTKHHLNIAARPEESFPTHTREAIEKIHQFNGAGHGHLSRHQLAGYFSRGTASGDGETRAYKDVIAGMANVSSEHPYSAVGTVGEGKTGVGRYMLTYDLLNTWLNDNPVKKAELEEKPQFRQLLQELKDNQRPSEALINQALPESSQEEITGDLIKNLSLKLKGAHGGTDAGKLALAFYLGHIPSHEEEENPGNQSFLGAAKRLTSLSVARVLYPHDGFDFQENDSSGCSTLALSLAAAAQKESSGSHAHGACSHYVRMAFDHVDPSLNRLFSQYAKDDHLGDDPRFKKICSSKSELISTKLKPGDTIIYGPRVGTRSAGHIETMGLDAQMHSDFSHKLTANFINGYEWVKVYRPIA